MKRFAYVFGALATLVISTGLLVSAHASAEAADLECKLKFSLTEWSAIYKHAEGTGQIDCVDGQSMKVAINAVGAGLTIGKFQIDQGTGKFTHVRKIEDVLGGYASAQADIGIVKSGSIQVLTKGTVSLALAGKGEGIDLGLDVSKFTIKAAK